MKLKTLEDLFGTKNHCNCAACGESFDCDIEKIRQEAINWIKGYRSWDNSKEIGNELAIQFMLFFNITEEDLK